MISHSDYYYKFPSELDDRIDFCHHHPQLDCLESLHELTSYEVTEFGNYINGEPLINCIFSGKTPDGISYINEGILFLGAGNIKVGKLDLTEVKHIDLSVHNGSLSSSKIEKNDVLITMAGTIGRSCIYEMDDEANINQAVAKVKINRAIVNEKFISKYLNSLYGQKGFQKHMHVVAQPNINLDEIQKIKIIVPPLDIQSKILEEIEPFENKAIEYENKFKSALENANKKIMDELSITFDEVDYFFKKGRQKNSDYYYIFEDEFEDELHYLFYHPKYAILKELTDKYNTVKLKDICDEPIKTGKQPKYADYGKMVIKTIDLKNRYIDYDNTLRVTEEFFSSKPTAHVHKGDILIAATGQGSVGKIDSYELEEPALADPQLLIIRLNDEYDVDFIKYYLRSPFGQIQFDKWFSGSSGQIHLYPEDLGNFLIPNADSISLEKQQEIANYITQEYEKATEYENKAFKEWEKSNKKFEALLIST